MNNTTIYTAVSLSLGLSLTVSNVSATEVRDIVNLNTSTQGVYEISYQALSAYGADVAGEQVSDIALMNQGQAVQIQVTGSNADPEVFGPGSVLRFVAQQVDTLYTDINVYTLRSDAEKAERMSEDNASMP